MKSNPYFNTLNMAVFDIETTGLMPYRDQIILGGIYSFAENSTVQFFCEDPSLEQETLKKISAALSEYDGIITYNGTTFDFPFLFRRLKENNLPLPELIYQSIDLYKWLKTYWPQADQMQSMRQKDIEYALGISPQRTDAINGSECIPLYNQYIETKDKQAKDAILLHNKDDILQLKRIAEALIFLPYHKIAYEQGFVVKVGQLKMVLLHTSLKKSTLTVSGKTQKHMKDAHIFKEPYHFQYNAESGAFELSMTCHVDGGIIYIDTREFPVDASSYAELSGFFQSFLILKDGDKIFYYETNQLIRELLINIVTEDLQLWIKT